MNNYITQLIQRYKDRNLKLTQEQYATLEKQLKKHIKKDKVLLHDKFKNLKRGDIIGRSTFSVPYGDSDRATANGIAVIINNDIERQVLLVRHEHGSYGHIYYSEVKQKGWSVRGSESFEHYYVDRFYRLNLRKNS